MLRHLLIITTRRIIRNKKFSLINITGLAIGMAAFMSIVIYVSHQMSFDKFWPDHENIYRASLQYYEHGVLTQHMASNYSPVAVLAKNNLPEVTNATRFGKLMGDAFSNRIKFIYQENQEITFDKESILATDSSFFQVFAFDFIKGSAEHYNKINTLVITASKADQFFGETWRNAEPGSNDDPIGKSIAMHSFSNKQGWFNFDHFNLAGIVEDIPENSHIAGEGFFYHEYFLVDHSLTFSINSFYTFLKLSPGANINWVESKLNDAIEDAYDSDPGNVLKSPLMALDKIHLQSNLYKEFKPGGNTMVIYALSIVAAMILFLAWLNYVNLTLVQDMERAKEVGLRKVIGAQKFSLLQQFLLKAFLINLISALLAINILVLALPLINQFLGTQLELALYYQGISYSRGFWLVFSLLFVCGTFVSGLYPALVVSSFQPAVALRGKITSRLKFMGTSFRSGIIVFQFMVAILLVMGTLIVVRQTNFMQSQPLGFDLDMQLVIENDFKYDSTLTDRFNVFEEQLSQHSFFQEVAISSAYPGEFNLDWDFADQHADEFNNFYLILVDYDFFSCYGIDFIAGRPFSKDYPYDKQRAIINEAAMKLLAYETPEKALQSKLKDRAHHLNSWEMVGVVQNHNHTSLHNQASPIVYLLKDATFYHETGRDGVNAALSKAEFRHNKDFINIRIAKGTEISQAIQVLQEIWSENFYNEPLRFFFLDDRYNQQYKSEVLFGKVFGLFSSLAILIACLGLIGFIAFSVKQRTKEIGIRKVLGAKVSQLWLLLSKDYFKLILVAYVIATPLTYWLFMKWLNTFAYQADLYWWLFLIPAVMIFAVAMMTISGQAVKAAKANPTETLRND